MNAVNNLEVEWQVRRIPLESIQVDPTVQQRAGGTCQDVVDEYAEAMRNGVAFPPIDVFGYADGPFHVGDGFHRLGAHLLAHPDVKDIECRVHPGDRDDALLFACGANAQHGLRRGRSDKVKAVTTLIRSERWSGWRRDRPAMRGLASVRRRGPPRTGNVSRCRPRARGRSGADPGAQYRRTGSTTHRQARRQALQIEYGAHRQKPTPATG